MRLHETHRRQTQTRRGMARRGAAAPWIVMMLPLLAAAMALAVEIASLSHRQVLLQNAADAAVLAAANAEAPATILIDPDIVYDILLTDRPDRQTRVLSDARRAARYYASLNPFPGGDVPLDPNPTNSTDGELLLGTLDGPDAIPTWTTPPVSDASLYNPHINAARVQIERQNVRVGVTAYVDRDVIGFKVRGTSHILSGTEAAIPVLPFAILSDWSDPPNDQSWEHNIINRDGVDDYRLDSSGMPVYDPDPMMTTPADGIPEITVRIMANGMGNGQVVAIPGPGSVAVALSQVTTGITASQLAAFDPVNRQLVLDEGGVNRKELDQITPASGDLQDLETELGKILGQRRVWMLYDTTPGGRVRVVGFVAARVMAVETDMATEAVNVVLQPTMLLTATALTDRTNRALGPREVALTQGAEKRSIYNPYVARVRLLK